MTDTQRLKDKLTNLRLKGMLQQLDTTLEQAVQKNLNVVATLGLLADLELEHRWHNAIHLRWRQSALTEKLTIDQFDFDYHKSRKEQKTRILALCTLDFVAAHSDVIFIGNPGTGKTFLAKCLAYAACNANMALVPFDAIRYRARFLDITVGESHDPRARGTSFSAEGKHDIDTSSMYRLWL
jgi:DNA replication protein DnaC